MVRDAGDEYYDVLRENSGLPPYMRRRETMDPPMFRGKPNRQRMALHVLEERKDGKYPNAKVRERVKELFGFDIKMGDVTNARAEYRRKHGPKAGKPKPAKKSSPNGKPRKAEPPDEAVERAWEEQDEEAGIKPRRREEARIKRHSPAELAMDLRQMVRDWGWDEVRKMLDVLNPEG